MKHLSSFTQPHVNPNLYIHTFEKCYAVKKCTIKVVNMNPALYLKSFEVIQQLCISNRLKIWLFIENLPFA